MTEEILDELFTVIKERQETLPDDRAPSVKECFINDMLQFEVDRRAIEEVEMGDVDTVAQETFGISASGLTSLRSQVKERKNKAFETVRRLSDSEDFNYMMEEFAETIDELGELAMLGTKYREEVLNEPSGFY